MLKDDQAGKKLRCKSCQSVIEVPAADSAAAPAIVREHAAQCPAFHHDRFLINQKKFSFNLKYFILDESGQPLLNAVRPIHFFRTLAAVLAWLVCTTGGIGTSIALGSTIQQQEVGIAITVIGILASVIFGIWALIKLAPKRHVTIYADEKLTEPVLEILQDQKFSIIRAWYTVRTPDGEVLGRLMKHYLYNFLRKRWYIFDTDGSNRLLAKEDSLILALMRKFLGGFFGLLRTNFIIVEPGTDRVIGEFNRKYSLFDKYVLDMSADKALEFDRRMAVALALMLDTGEHR